MRATADAASTTAAVEWRVLNPHPLRPASRCSPFENATTVFATFTSADSAWWGVPNSDLQRMRCEGLDHSQNRADAECMHAESSLTLYRQRHGAQNVRSCRRRHRRRPPDPSSLPSSLGSTVVAVISIIVYFISVVAFVIMFAVSIAAATAVLVTCRCLVVSSSHSVQPSKDHRHALLRRPTQRNKPATIARPHLCASPSSLPSSPSPPPSPPPSPIAATVHRRRPSSSSPSTVLLVAFHRRLLRLDASLRLRLDACQLRELA